MRTNESPQEEPPLRKWEPVRKLWPLVAGLLAGLGLRLVFDGDAGELFSAMTATFVIGTPAVVAAVTVYAADRIQPRSVGFDFVAGMVANVLFVTGTFLVFLEGLICTVIALPVFAGIGGFAGLLTGAVCRWFRYRGATVLSVSLAPLLLAVMEQRVPLPEQIDSVSVSREISAEPGEIWQVIVRAEDIKSEEIGSAWMYRIGVPMPLSAVVEHRGEERLRHIRMGKGIAFDQVITHWQPESRIRFTYRFTPDSFPPRALDDHVLIGGEYFDLIDTEYVLEPSAHGTRMTARMTYRVSTHFNWYSRFVARLLIGNFEETALEFFARRAARP